jgi:hypothetical protein
MISANVNFTSSLPQSANSGAVQPEIAGASTLKANNFLPAPIKSLALIGSRGLFGNKILTFCTPDCTYNSDNINDLSRANFDTVICAAPSANRRIAQVDPEADANSVDQIISALSSHRIKRLILIGTIDTIVHPESVYGRNRLRLENFVKQEFVHHYVLRFGNIVDTTIKKNVLYDLKHNQFLDSINLDSMTQWYPLDRLQADIEHALTYDKYEHTLVSDSIQVREIVEKFFPEKLSQVGTAPGPIANYNLAPSFSKQLVFGQMEEYVHRV